MKDERLGSASAASLKRHVGLNLDTMYSTDADNAEDWADMGRAAGEGKLR